MTLKQNHEHIQKFGKIVMSTFRFSQKKFTGSYNQQLSWIDAHLFKFTLQFEYSFQMK